MLEVSSTKSWRDELASLVEDTGIRYSADGIGVSATAFGEFDYGVSSPESESGESESFKDQVRGFAEAWGEMIVELGKGLRDVVQQNVLTEDSYIVQKVKDPLVEASNRLSFLNEYLPEDRDPVHAWPVIFFVLFLAFAVLTVNTRHENSSTLVKKVYMHPPTADRIPLPDGRYLAYHEIGVSANKARFSLIAPHCFLCSRLAGVPGVEVSLLEEYGLRLITYDLPGFGESDPYPSRNLNSSALDILYLADAIGVHNKFWVLGFSSGAIHAWAALKYIPNRVAGAVMLAPMVNPYESGMTKEELATTWEKWTQKRKTMFFLARRFPKFLSYFYHRTFLSGKHGQIDKWLSLSLEKKDRALIEEQKFEEFWQRNVEESVRQGSAKPFIEEAVLQVSHWGFSLADLQVQKKCPKGIFPWLKFMYSQAECELTGFLGPIHIWQGMDDLTVPPSMTDYVTRILPTAIVHKLPDEGHFSYYFFCNECHRQIFSTIFGSPKGPLEITKQASIEGDIEEAPPLIDSTTE